MSSGDSRDHSLAPGRPAIPAVRKEELGLARGAQIRPFDLLDAGIGERARRRLPQVELAVDDDAGAETVDEWARDVRTDLVAARADPRTDRSGETAASQHPDTVRDDPSQ